MHLISSYEEVFSPLQYIKKRLKLSMHWNFYFKEIFFWMLVWIGEKENSESNKSDKIIYFLAGVLLKDLHSHGLSASVMSAKELEAVPQFGAVAFYLYTQNNYNQLQVLVWKMTLWSTTFLGTLLKTWSVAVCSKFWIKICLFLKKRLCKAGWCAVTNEFAD